MKILIADDHGVVAEGLRHVIETQPDMEVIACVANGSDAVRSAIEAGPDVVVMDYAMPRLNGSEATRMIRERCPNIRIIMLSMYSAPGYVLRALQAGAAGYIVKKSAASEVVEAIREVHAGRRYLSRQFTDGTIDQFLQEATAGDPLTRLSSRERQVLQLLAEGRTNAEIAATLALSPKSVETYRGRMEQKLGLHDLASLIKFAIQNGVISIE
ncbi:MAG TPA: response regulator transcription factor [Rudaea sp.]|jgi:DNA-binding NarL/FixJ family response regulator